MTIRLVAIHCAVQQRLSAGGPRAASARGHVDILPLVLNQRVLFFIGVANVK
jgi:hypothetical protein